MNGDHVDILNTKYIETDFDRKKMKIEVINDCYSTERIFLRMITFWIIFHTLFHNISVQRPSSGNWKWQYRCSWTKIRNTILPKYYLYYFDEQSMRWICDEGWEV